MICMGFPSGYKREPKKNPQQKIMHFMHFMQPTQTSARGNPLATFGDQPVGGTRKPSIGSCSRHHPI